MDRIFGIGGESASEYRRALCALRQDSLYVDYLVVTQFVDMNAIDGGAMPRNEDIAERLQSVVPGLSSSTVMSALLRFAVRLRGS